MDRDVDYLRSLIFNDAYMVRRYSRNHLRRRQAIQKLGETIRFCFSQTDDYEALIAAVLDAFRPEDRQPF